MKSMKPIYIIITTITLITCSLLTQAQYFENLGIRVLQNGEHAHGMRYRTTVDFPSKYEDSLEQIITTIATDMYGYNANVIKLNHRLMTNITYNKRGKGKVKEKYLFVQADIYYANQVEKLKVISIDSYIDSLKRELLRNDTNHALVVIYPSVRLLEEKEFPEVTFSFEGKIKCKLDGPKVCSYEVSKQLPLHFNVGMKGQFTLIPKNGEVYFLEFIPTPRGNFIPADFLIAYRQCKDIQEFNDEQDMMKQ